MRRKILMQLVGLILVATVLACSDDPPPTSSGISTKKIPDEPGFVTSQPAQARALVHDAQLKAILTSGDIMPGSGLPWAPTPDGLGAYEEGRELVVFANHELTAAGVTSSDGGPAFTFSRVSRLVLDEHDLSVKSGRYVEDGSSGLIRLCSATWVDATTGFNTGLFLTGEENGATNAGSIVTAFDGAGLRMTLPQLGAFSHENTIGVPGFGNRVVTFGFDDSAGQSELYMYVAADETAFLAGNGKLFVFRTDVKAPSGKNMHSGNLIEGQPITGSFVEIADPADLGAAPAARYNRLQAKVDALGAFPFVRLEDGDYDKSDKGRKEPAIYFVDTGAASVTGRTQVNADCGGICDLAGSLYRMELNPADPTTGAKLVLVQRSLGVTTGWASPDNIATNKKGIMIMEDPAYDGYNGVRAPGIWHGKFKGHGDVEKFTEVVEVTQELLIPGPAGKCVDATATCWESSGIISTENWLGEGTWLFDVQAHTLPFSTGTGASKKNYGKESGQLLFLKLPGS